jgi:hypothetical protein
MRYTDLPPDIQNQVTALNRYQGSHHPRGWVHQASVQSGSVTNWERKRTPRVTMDRPLEQALRDRQYVAVSHGMGHDQAKRAAHGQEVELESTLINANDEFEHRLTASGVTSCTNDPRYDADFQRLFDDRTRQAYALAEDHGRPRHAWMRPFTHQPEWSPAVQTDQSQAHDPELSL